MSTVRAIGGTAVNHGMHKAMCGLSEKYTANYKAAAVKSTAHAAFAKNVDLFKRDTSEPNNFFAMYEDAVKTAGLRRQTAKTLLSQLAKGNFTGEIGTKAAMQKAGVNTTLGYNFYDLRGPALLLYPVFTPFRNQIARAPKVNAGTGTAAHWKATRNVGSQYAGVPEGQRAQVASPDENDFIATYKGLGVERNVTFEGEWAGEGFTGNLADEHLRGLHEMWLQEEGIILLGNAGTAVGGNGFQLGTAPAPVAALAAGGAIAAGTSISARVVLLTGMGNPSNAQYGYQAAPSVATGLVPTFSYNAPGTGQQITLNGGMSAVSAQSNTVETADGQQSVTFTVSGYPNGVFGYAWFVSSNAAPTAANSFLTAITQFPTFTLAAAPPTAGQAASAAGLNVDNSSQPYDFDGLLTWTAKYGKWIDLAGGTLTGVAGGQCEQVEAMLDYFFTNFQAGVDGIWGSPDAIKSLSDVVLSNGGANTGYQFVAMKDDQNNLIGGVIVSGYRSRYAVDSPMGAGIIPMKMHPMIPPGTLYFDISKNPYPHSRIPATREIFLMRDYYGIEWPAIARQWAFGTYADEVLAHYAPWLTGVITGIGQS